MEGCDVLRSTGVADFAFRPGEIVAHLPEKPDFNAVELDFLQIEKLVK